MKQQITSFLHFCPSFLRKQEFPASYTPSTSFLRKQESPINNSGSFIPSLYEIPGQARNEGLGFSLFTQCTSFLRLCSSFLRKQESPEE